ncbi:MAG: hypothetical protein RLZZ04_4729 [Cyanobacteriota bacterium]
MNIRAIAYDRIGHKHNYPFMSADSIPISIEIGDF